MSAKRGDQLDHGSGRDSPNSWAGAEESDQLVRLSVNLGPAVADTLKGYASRKGVSVTEAVRRAISILAYIDSAQNRGASLNIEEGGKLKEIQFLC
jgi:hypothetical protein